MKSPDLSRNSFSGAPFFASSQRTAHSGPELLSFVPQPSLAHDLAQTLLADSIQVSRGTSTSSFGSESDSGFVLNLSRH